MALAHRRRVIDYQNSGPREIAVRSEWCAAAAERMATTCMGAIIPRIPKEPLMRPVTKGNPAQYDPNTPDIQNAVTQTGNALTAIRGKPVAGIVRLQAPHGNRDAG